MFSAQRALLGVCLLLLCALNSQPCRSQQKIKQKKAANITANTGKEHPTSPVSTDTTAAKPPLTPDDLVGIVQNPQDPHGDYIPCKFQLSQLRGLVLPDVAPTLSASDSDRLRQRVIAAALGTSKTPNQIDEQMVKFANDVAATSFQGRTPGESLALLIQLLNGFHVQSVSEARDNSKALKELFPASDFPQLQALIARPTPATNILAETKTKALSVPSDKLKTVEDLAAEEQQYQANTTATATAAVLDEARKAVALAERPTDVGCAMSILDWKETSQAFGHLIANEYIAIQVVIRNLNRDQQFLLHDIEFQVNSDPTGRLGRFFSGRDKIIVRALSSSQSVGDPRNIVVHTATGIGHLLTAIAPFTLPGEAVTYAASAMSATLVPDLANYWKDLTTEQAHLLDDVGFSSTANTQSVVPKSGTAMYVIFTPARPFEEGWWTLPCVETQYLGTANKNGRVINLSRGDADSISTSGLTAAGTLGLTPTPTGIDVARALEGCLKQSVTPRDTRKWYRLYFKTGDEHKLIQMDSGILDQLVSIPPACLAAPPATPAVTAPSGKKPSQGGTGNPPEKGPACPDFNPNMDLFRNVYRNPYHHWSPNSQAIFREIANTVVSGMHITEDEQLLASVGDLKCPKDASGNLQLPAAGSDLSCPVTGRNLAKISKLRLRNSKNPIDLVFAEGALTISGDSTAGTVKFSGADLRLLMAAQYDVFSVSSNGAENKTSVVINLDTTPTITGFSPPADFSDGKPSLAFTITGTHLSAAQSITLTKGTKTLPISINTPAADTTLTGQILPSAVKTAALPNGPVTLTVLDADGKPLAKADGKVTLTGPK